jgi:hypothetical protein
MTIEQTKLQSYLIKLNASIKGINCTSRAQSPPMLGNRYGRKTTLLSGIII